MISSAVVIPETTASQIDSPSLKRRQSTVDFDDSNKRPRIDTDDVNGGSQNGNSSHSNGRVSPVSSPQRRSSQLATKKEGGVSEEKKRGRRLFGSLLGTLSQANTKPAHKKRDEIEARQRERLRKDDEEREQQQREKKQELDRIRWTEQKDWLREGMKIRHRNMRATARFLRTKAEPRLFYMPWEVRIEEQEQIARQKEEVEEMVRQELAGDEHDKQNGGMNDHDHDRSRTRSKSPLNQEGQQNCNSRVDTVESVEHDTSHASETRHEAERQDDNDATPSETLEDRSDSFRKGGKVEDEKGGNDEHHGEELVEGQEDDVIY